VAVERSAAVIYAVTLVAYVVKEFVRVRRGGGFTLPKQLWLLGTALSWYVGIVALNGDMAFTITNVVGHGLPYLGLIWIYGARELKHRPQTQTFFGVRLALFFRLSALPAFAGLLLLLAFAEEGLWHGLIWREHLSFFQAFAGLPRVTDAATLSWLVPLLSLPQVTHYLLDGFLWKVSNFKTPAQSSQKIPTDLFQIQSPAVSG
jgi:hypothetical protein